jgi:HD-like signal output (HDOD) protein/DNA-directed RNA polymerase subunit RPC12/RpoP
MIIAKCSSCRKTYRIPKERLPTGKKVSFSCPNCKGRIVLDLRTPKAGDPLSSHRSQIQSEKTLNHSEPSPNEAHQLLNRIEHDIKDIPFMPQVVIKAQKAMADSKTGGKQLADILQTDPAIVTSMLKIANSAYYGLSGRVSSIEKACVILGYQTVKDLVMTTGVSNLLGKKLKGYGFDSGELWMHSMAVGIASKMIATKIYPELSDDAYLSGLLHDSGKIILDPYILERKKAFDLFLKSGDQTNFEAEKHILGFDHAEIASKICKKWNIPKDITTAILNHHHPSASGKHALSYIVHTGDCVARLCGLGYEEDDILYEAEKGAIEFLGLDRKILGEMMLEVLEAVQQIGQALKK